MRSGRRYFASTAPITTESTVTSMYPHTEPNHTETGFPVLAVRVMLTIWVLSANSARKTALKVIKNTLQSIVTPLLLEGKIDSPGFEDIRVRGNILP
jgi:hypothetical protein